MTITAQHLESIFMQPILAHFATLAELIKYILHICRHLGRMSGSDGLILRSRLTRHNPRDLRLALAGVSHGLQLIICIGAAEQNRFRRRAIVVRPYFVRLRRLWVFV